MQFVNEVVDYHHVSTAECWTSQCHVSDAGADERFTQEKSREANLSQKRTFVWGFMPSKTRFPVFSGMIVGCIISLSCSARTALKYSK